MIKILFYSAIGLVLYKFFNKSSTSDVNTPASLVAEKQGLIPPLLKDKLIM